MDKEHIGAGGRVQAKEESASPAPEAPDISALRGALTAELARARRELGISQKRLEALSGVRQPVIARMERGRTDPRLDTFLKALAPLGKTLYIGDTCESETARKRKIRGC
jgi:ribosome-binding protein aMBF1 (putative translation factor)